MTNEERLNHIYLGDGVYAEFNGYHIILRTGNHLDELCDNKIFMEKSVIDNLIKFVDYLESRESKIES